MPVRAVRGFLDYLITYSQNREVNFTQNFEANVLMQEKTIAFLNSMILTARDNYLSTLGMELTK